MHARIAALALLAATGACGDAPAVRLVAGRRDTVVVHNRTAVPLPVFGFDRNGDTVEVRNLRFRRTAGAPIRVTSSGTVTCERPGDAEFEVSHRRLATRFILMCRPIMGFRFGGNAKLTVGGPSVPMQLDAVGVDGESVAPIMGTALVEDSSVVTVQGMHLAAKSPGRTRVEVAAGDCRTDFDVEVNERVASLRGLEPFQEFVTPISMVAGEVQTWPIGKGDYIVDFQPAKAGGPAVVVGAAGAQCSRWTFGEHHCLALNPSKIVLRHPGEAGTGALVTGQLSVRLVAHAKRTLVRQVRRAPRRRGQVCSDFRLRVAKDTRQAATSTTKHHDSKVQPASRP
jgi:hypothetical protein